MAFTWPRRNSIPHLAPAELAIRNATIEVEKDGCDVLLTDAVIFLEQARSRVADYIDKMNPEGRVVILGGLSDARIEITEAATLSTQQASAQPQNRQQAASSDSTPQVRLRGRHLWNHHAPTSWPDDQWMEGVA